MYRIYKEIDSSGIEILPFVENTPIIEKCDIFQLKPGTQKYIAFILYQAIQKRENYYQENTPPAFGDPEYARHASYVAGFLDGCGMKETKEQTPEGELIVIKKGKRRFLVIDKVKKPRSYYNAVRDNHEILKSLGF